MEFVNGKDDIHDDIPYMENKIHVPKHQPVFAIDLSICGLMGFPSGYD